MKTIILFLALLCCQLLYAQKATRNIYFDFAKHDINTTALRILDNLYDSILSKNTVRRIYLYGYCDSVGKSGFNDTLSLKRVASVKKFFIQKGIHDSAFKIIKGYGKQKPLNANATENERQANRRVEMIITYDKKKTEPAQKPKYIPNIDTANVKVGSKMILKNIQFQGGMHRFLPSSADALNELLQLMLDNPNLEIQIIGYICCLPEEYSDGQDFETGITNLSEARAIAVLDFLVSNGVKRQRLKYKGMGPKNKITKEISEEDKATNRRVEILILRK
ncbi:MAG: OmpA family protein [Bacteroidota bacterium]|nr:OmpA family protein [Bacteroidota bacterium]